MKESCDLVIGRSGDREINFTAETRRRGEESGDRYLRNAWGILLATLREVFDESAYERFLLRTKSLRSHESYRDFMSERERSAARNPRCC
jgi:hypothetical protein